MQRYKSIFEEGSTKLKGFLRLGHETQWWDWDSLKFSLKNQSDEEAVFKAWKNRQLYIKDGGQELRNQYGQTIGSLNIHKYKLPYKWTEPEKGKKLRRQISKQKYNDKITNELEKEYPNYQYGGTALKGYDPATDLNLIRKQRLKRSRN